MQFSSQERTHNGRRRFRHNEHVPDCESTPLLHGHTNSVQPSTIGEEPAAHRAATCAREKKFRQSSCRNAAPPILSRKHPSSNVNLLRRPACQQPRRWDPRHPAPPRSHHLVDRRMAHYSRGVMYRSLAAPNPRLDFAAVPTSSCSVFAFRVPAPLFCRAVRSRSPNSE